MIETAAFHRRFPWLALLVSAVVGLIIGLPHLLIPLTHPGQHYSPFAVDNVSLLTFEETLNFASETREVLDGHWPVRDVSTWEHKNDPAPFPLLPPLVGAALAKLTGSVEGGFIVADFLFPALTVFFSSLLLRRLTGRGSLGLLAGSALVIGIDFFQKFPPYSKGTFLALLDFFRIDPGTTVPLSFGRFFYPELPVMLLILFGWVFAEAMSRRRVTWAIGAGVAFAATIWTYTFTWTAIAAGLLLFGIVAALRRDREDVRLVGWVIAFGVVLSIPVWWQAVTFMTSPNANDILERLGLQTGHFLNVNRSLEFALFGLATLLLFFRRPTPAERFLVLLVAGGVLCLQVQLLTGSTFQSWHWASRVLSPWAFVVLAASLAKLTRNTHLVRVGIATFTAVLIGWGALWQIAYAENVGADHVRPSPYDDAFAWLNDHAEKDSVVGSISMATNAQLTGWTSENVLLPFGGETVAPTEEIIDRSFVLFRLYGFTADEVRVWFAPDPERDRRLSQDCGEERCRLDWSVKDRDLTASLTTFTWLRIQEAPLNFSYSLAMPPEELDRLERRYKALPAAPEEVLARYRFDYLILGPNELRHGGVNDVFLRFLEPVYRDANVEIDRVKGERS